MKFLAALLLGGCFRGPVMSLCAAADISMAARSRCCGACRSRASCCRLRSCRSWLHLRLSTLWQVGCCRGLAFLLPFAIRAWCGGREPCMRFVTGHPFVILTAFSPWRAASSFAATCTARAQQPCGGACCPWAPRALLCCFDSFRCSFMNAIPLRFVVVFSLRLTACFQFKT